MSDSPSVLGIPQAQDLPLLHLRLFLGAATPLSQP